MKIACPKCGHTAEVDDSVIPEGTTSVRCNACETRFPLVNMFEVRMEQWEWDEVQHYPSCNIKDLHGNFCTYYGVTDHSKGATKPDMFYSKDHFSDASPSATVTEISFSIPGSSETSEQGHTAGIDENVSPPSNSNKIQELMNRFVKSKWHLISLSLIYAFLILILFLYTIFYKVPPYNELHRSEGIVFFKSVPKRGSLTGLATTTGKVFFTCRSPFGKSNHDIPVHPEVLNNLEGKRATVLWYRRPMYIGSSANYLIDLQVDDQRVISREMMLDSMEIDAKLALLFSFAALITFIILYRYNVNKAIKTEICHHQKA